MAHQSLARRGTGLALAPATLPIKLGIIAGVTAVIGFGIFMVISAMGNTTNQDQNTSGGSQANQTTINNTEYKLIDLSDLWDWSW